MTQNAAQPPAGHVAMVMRECGICQSSIYPDEQTLTCPSCSLTFHLECWNDNFGCAAYGCEQVNVLKPREEKPVEELVFHQPIQQSIERLPWNFVLLGAAALAMAASSMTWGIPSLIVIAAIIWRMYATRGRGQRLVGQIILLLATILSVVGLIAGIFISRYWHT